MNGPVAMQLLEISPDGLWFDNGSPANYVRVGRDNYSSSYPGYQPVDLTFWVWGLNGYTGAPDGFWTDEAQLNYARTGSVNVDWSKCGFLSLYIHSASGYYNWGLGVCTRCILVEHGVCELLSGWCI